MSSGSPDGTAAAVAAVAASMQTAAQQESHLHATAEELSALGLGSEGDIIGPYRIGATIGQGIFAKVKLGLDELEQPVAIKVFDKIALQKQQNRHQLQQIEKEINALRICSHPNVVQFYDVLETETKVFLVMEHLPYGELYDYILDKGKLSEVEAGHLFGQILSAIYHCHQRGIVHRDLKPENILLASDSQIKLVDFGLANYFDTSHPDKYHVKNLRTQCGSPHYAAPEILTGQRYNGIESDIWSLGVLLYAMLCGSLPFNARSIPLLIKKIVEGKYKLPKFLSSAARHLISSILQIQAENRPSLEQIMTHPWIKAYAPSVAREITGEVDLDGSNNAIALGLDGNNNGGPSSTASAAKKPLSRPEIIPPMSYYPTRFTDTKLGQSMLDDDNEENIWSADDDDNDSDEKGIFSDGNIDSSSRPVAQSLASSKELAFNPNPSTAADEINNSNFTPADIPPTRASAASLFIPRATNNPSNSSSTSSTTSNSPRRPIRCHKCQKLLSVRMTQTGDFVLSTSVPASSPLLSAQTNNSNVVHPDLCQCAQNPSSSSFSVSTQHTDPTSSSSSTTASSATKTGPTPASADSADYSSAQYFGKFEVETFRQNYFKVDDPKRKRIRNHRGQLLEREDEKAEKARKTLEEELFRASERGDLATVSRLVLPSNDDPTVIPLVDARATTIDNFTALHFAARGGHTSCVDVLLKCWQPLDINARTKSGWSPLMMAADKGHKEVITLLLKYGAAIHITNADGKSAIFLARESGHADIATELTTASSNRHKRHTKAQNADSGEQVRQLNHELCRAAECGDLIKVQHLLSLGKTGGRPTSPDRVSHREQQAQAAAAAAAGAQGAPATPAANSSSSAPPTRILVDINGRGIDNWTALHYAARKGRLAIVQLLLTHEPKADVNALTKNRWTPLMLACDRGHYDVCKVLLDFQADMTVKSNDGLTALAVAKEGQFNDIVKLLKQHSKS